MMRKFLNLTWRDKYLLLSAAFWLAAIRLGLLLLPFSALRAILGFAARGGAWFRFQLAEGRVAWAVMAAGRRHPFGSTCLTRALAAQVMLARRALPCRFVIGVAKDERGGLEAHAWLECGEKVLIGGPDVSRFTPLATLNDDCLGALV